MHESVVDLRSDTVTLPSAAMLATIPSAILGDDIMGEDPTVRRLETTSAALLGMEDALLVSSGTMANQIAVMVFTRRGDEVIMGADSHMYNLETGALAALSQVQVRCVGAGDGMVHADEIESVVLPRDARRLQSAETGLICLENTYNLNAGRVVTVEETDAVSRVAAAHAVPVYLDGARIFNAASALDVAPSELCRSVDAVQFCLTKGLSAPVGSILSGSRDFIKRARKIRQRLGGGMRQAGIIAAPALYALENLRTRIPDDHSRARTLASGLAAIDGLEVPLDTVETNIVPVTITLPGWDAERLLAALRQENIKAKPIGVHRFRMVTHLDIDDAAIQRVTTTVRRLLAQ